jgi:Asp-tRNA(Asn)/Glu-tRNA(Gln) amidotransferase A subunit family amidase
MQTELLYRSIAELGVMLRRRQISPVELTTTYLARARALDPKLFAVVSFTEELAMEQARAAEAEIRKGRYRGPLHGIPWGVKDLFSTKGIPTQWGSPAFRGQVFDYDATIVRRLRDAGAVLMAKLSTGELAGGAHWFGGVTRCPWDTTRSSSGSSAGPGSATAAGMVGFSIGTETVGSIISPASVNGIVGLRPTYGRVSRHGCMAAGWTRDKPGPMCRSVEDCALVLRQIMGADPEDSSAVDAPFTFTPGSSVKGLKVAVLREEFDMPRDDEVREVQQAALKVVGDLGVTLEELTLTKDLPYREAAAVIGAVESAAVWEPLWDSPRRREFIRRTRADGWAAARMIPAVDYVKAERIRAEIMKYTSGLFRQYAAIVAPSWMGPAWMWTAPEEADSISPTRGDPKDPNRPQPQISTFSNLVGIPAVSVPCGFTKSGLPLGLQFLGAAYDEGRILQLAHAYERAAPWRGRHPSID